MKPRVRVAAALVLLVTSMAAAPRWAEGQQAGGADAAGHVDDGLPPELGRSPVRVTLLTGDRVTVTRVGGELTTAVEAGSGREDVRFSTQQAGEHLYVVPSDAVGLLGAGRLDRRLFDVAGLVAAGYDDAHRSDVPLIVQPEPGRERAARGRPPAPVPEAAVTAAGADATVLPPVGATVVRQPKDRTGELWDQVVTAAAGGDPTARTLDAGIGSVWLDGVRRAVLDRSVAQVGAPQAWAAGFTGAGVRVAVLDSGVDVTHPDLAGRVVQAENFTSEPDTDDLFGHGTHVASILGGTGAASDERYRGVAPDAELLNGKVCDGFGDCAESDILAGMAWAADGGARVVNMSLGGPDGPEVDPLEAAVDTLSATHGMLFVVAAGNGGPDAETVGSPASADAALAVGSVDDGDEPAEDSARGPRVGDAALKPEITAPGVGIVAAQARNGFIGEPVGDTYVSLDGTSMATPHVAGGAALVAQQHPDWTGAQIRALLVGSARPTDGVDATVQGAGRLDLARAVDQVVTADPAVVSAGRTPWPHDDDDEPVRRTITYRNVGPEPVTLALGLDATGPAGDAPDGMFGLGADTVTVPAGGEAPVTVTVDTSVPGPDGHYSAWVTATAGTTVVTTPVAIDREGERHELTVHLRDRAGEPATEYDVIVFGLDTGTVASPYSPDGTVTVRLPPGRYAVSGFVYGEWPSLSVMVAPGVGLDRDRTVEMDARSTAPVDVTVARDEAELRLGALAHRLRGTAGDFLSVLSGSSTGLADLTAGQVGPAVADDVLTSVFRTTWATPDDDGGFDRSERVYELAWFARGRMFTGLTKQVRDGQLARVRATYRAAGPDHVGIAWAAPRPPGGEPLGTTGVLTQLPLRRTVLHNTEGVEWAGELEVIADPEGQFLGESIFEGPFRRLRPGDAGTETWNPAVLTPLVSGVWRQTDAAGRSQRAGDLIHAELALFGDGAGRPGRSNYAAARTTLRRDGEVVGETDSAGFGQFTVAPEAADYRLEVDVTRPPGALLSTRITTAWSFRSAHVSGDEPEPLPLLGVRFAPPLDVHNRTPAGRTLQVPVTVDRLGDVGRVGTPTVEASFDDGATWSAVPVRRVAAGGFVATVRHPVRSGFVSLRASARDDRGGAVEQTIVRAYELTTAP